VFAVARKKKNICGLGKEKEKKKEGDFVAVTTPRQPKKNAVVTKKKGKKERFLRIKEGKKRGGKPVRLRKLVTKRSLGSDPIRTESESKKE